MKRGIEWLLGAMDQDQNLFPEGYGIMEVSGLNAELIDVAVYTQQALEAAAGIAEVMDDTDAKDRYRKLASDLKARINQRFWIERDGTYADFYGSRAAGGQRGRRGDQANRAQGRGPADAKRQGADRTLRTAEGGVLRDAGSGQGLDHQQELGHRNADGDRHRSHGCAIALLDKIRRENSGEYGPYLSAVEGQAMMTISTGVQAVAEANYGRIDAGDVVRRSDRSNLQPRGAGFNIGNDARLWLLHDRMDQLRHRCAIDRACVRHPTGRSERDSRVRAPSSCRLGGCQHRRPSGRHQPRFFFTDQNPAQGVDPDDIEAKENGWSFVLREPPASGADISSWATPSSVFRRPYGWEEESSAGHCHALALLCSQPNGIGAR